MTKPNWYIVYTKSRYELRVAHHLTKKHIKNYCRLYTSGNQFHESKRLLQEPLFASYVFVYITDSQMPFIKSFPGVINFLYWLNKPATITDEEINSLIRLLKDYADYRLEKRVIPQNNAISLGQNYPVNNNTPAPEDQVKLLLPSLGYCIIARHAFALGK